MRGHALGFFMPKKTAHHYDVRPHEKSLKHYALKIKTAHRTFAADGP